MEKSATRYACTPARRRNAASPTSADGTERALHLAAAEAPDRDAEADGDPGDRPHEIQRRGRLGREERITCDGGAGVARRRDDALRLECPHRAAPHAVSGKDEPRRRADVLSRLILQREPDAADDAAYPAHTPQDECDDTADHSRQTRRQRERQREDDDPFEQE